MVAEVIDGKQLSHDLKMKMKEEVSQLKNEGISPHLTVILVGDNPASKSYVKGKEKACAETGISSDLIKFTATIGEKELLNYIETLNNERSIHGILVQLPLSSHIKEQKIIEAIHPLKDVDGFHPINIGRMMTGQETFLSCTPYGIITMLKSRKIQIEEKHTVVIGRSNIVGKPVEQLLLNEHTTV